MTILCLMVHTHTHTHTQLPKRRRGVPTQHNHYTCARTQGFLVQSVVKINEKGDHHHIANHIIIMR